ncbi:hypothetical protein H2200_013430 [Cladophialophora chaetospira]|uniref:Azaphilone pigments biosynthesis cluster protein L N-terminal domain-containing protein n=1 Tax=Cladophialophora chaetospira TaxID=386627 RepID=A0AA38U905_9EURO|nr:hypothetical protein H2200_013430 [Cladophialophora chaetospira]
MSGIEILGIAASVIQIADLGARLSVKLFVFSRKIKSADKSIESISQDIAVTGAILQQLGDEISKDENADLITKEALKTTEGLISGCQKVFTELDSELDGRVSKNVSVVVGWKNRVKFALLEAQIDLLRSNLERLKSSLLLILNVLTFAVQVRSHRNVNALKDHRELVETLIRDKNASDRKYQQAKQALEWKEPQPTSNGTERDLGLEPSSNTGGSLTVPDTASFLTTAAINVTARKRHPADKHDPPPSDQTLVLPVDLRRRIEENEHHGIVIEGLLLEVRAPKYNITSDFRDKLHQGILRVHWEHWSSLRAIYRHRTLMEAFAKHPEVVRYWLSRLKGEAPARAMNRVETGDRESFVVDVQSQPNNAHSVRNGTHRQVLEFTSADRFQRSSTFERTSVTSSGLSNGKPHLQEIRGPVRQNFNGNSFAKSDKGDGKPGDLRKSGLPSTNAPAALGVRTLRDVTKASIPLQDNPHSSGANILETERNFTPQSRKSDIISPYASGKPNDRVDAYVLSPSPDPNGPSNYRGSSSAGSLDNEHRREAWHAARFEPDISAVVGAKSRTQDIDSHAHRTRSRSSDSSDTTNSTVTMGPMGVINPNSIWPYPISDPEDDISAPLPSKLRSEKAKHQGEHKRYDLEERSRLYRKVTVDHDRFDDDDDRSPKSEGISSCLSRRDSGQYIVEAGPFAYNTGGGPQDHKSRCPVLAPAVHGTNTTAITEAVTALQSPSEQILSRNEKTLMTPFSYTPQPLPTPYGVMHRLPVQELIEKPPVRMRGSRDHESSDSMYIPMRGDEGYLTGRPAFSDPVATAGMQRWGERNEQRLSAQKTQGRHFRSEGSAPVPDLHRRGRLEDLDRNRLMQRRAGQHKSEPLSTARDRSEDFSAWRHRVRDRMRGSRSSAKRPITADDLPYKVRKELDSARISRPDKEERKPMESTPSLWEAQSAIPDPFTPQPGRYTSGQSHGPSPPDGDATTYDEAERRTEDFTADSKYETASLSHDIMMMYEDLSSRPIESSFEDYIARWTQVSADEYS